jgi:hypothetical protein
LVTSTKLFPFSGRSDNRGVSYIERGPCPNYRDVLVWSSPYDRDVKISRTTRDALAGKCYKAFVMHYSGLLRVSTNPEILSRFAYTQPTAVMKTPVSDQRGAIAYY